MTVATRPYTYDYLVFIGRFQPLHNGHCAVISEAFKQSKKVIVLVGSANSSRRPRNPFSFGERLNMILRAFPEQFQAGRLFVMPLNDYTYNDTAWVSSVQRTVDKVILDDLNGGGVHLHGTNDAHIGLIGLQKDGSSYYLKKFPQWNSVAVPEHSVFHATNIRNDFLKPNFIIPSTLHVPSSVKSFLETFALSKDFKRLVDYNQHCIKYKASMSGTPFPTMIGCSDNVVTQSGHILLVTRKGVLGGGLLALPGGHVNAVDEPFRDAAVRELKEETRMADTWGEIPPGKLDAMIVNEKLFDDPYRSERGRVISMAYHYKLPEGNLYRVRGDDDAEKAAWYKIGKLDPTMFFEDHYHIIKYFLGDI